MTTAPSSLPPDAWDQPNPSPTSRRKVPVQTVPDDWDDDEDEDEDGPVTEEVNQRIWDDANAKAANPMPMLVIAPSATSASYVVPPPQSAFQPTMRILKRPNSGANSKSATLPPSSSAETLKEREARYQAARERIFGPDTGTTTPLSEELSTNASNSAHLISFTGKRERAMEPTPSAVVRNPKGPPRDGETTTRGFCGQRAKPPSSHSPPQTRTEG
ncbi:hypothetical protein H0H87_004471 [Tephrocybe sp. NHM501043]|nr:hypothetical protein H0H87_004471 [Tephrocybe sp. NHM501043]